METHLDLGRLEGRDGAGERGGDASHFVVGFVLCVLREACAGSGNREAPGTAFVRYFGFPNPERQVQASESSQNQFPTL